MKTFTLILALCLACSTALTAGPASAADPLLLRGGGAGSSTALDLKRDVGWLPGAGITNNASLLNAIMLKRAREFAFLLPCGAYELTDTVVIGPRTGYALVGSGGISYDLGDAHYTGETTATYGGPVSRLVWKGNATAPMLRLDGHGATVSALHFQGRRMPTSDTKAKIGLHINTSTGAGNESYVPSKCRIDHLSFCQIETCVLVGTSLTGDGSELDDNHADSITAGDLHCYYLFDGANVGSCVHIRNDQSVCNSFETIFSSGDPAQVFYLERGGKTRVGLISLTSGATATTAAVRVGIINADQAVLTVEHVSIDATSVLSRLLVMDNDTTSLAVPIIEIGSAVIPVNNVAPILVDLRHGSIFLRNIWGLRPETIRMIGTYVSATDKKVCHVHLDNCVLAGAVDWPDDLVSADSTGPYRLTWTRCCKLADSVNTAVRGKPYEDGETSRNINSGSTPLEYYTAP